MKRKLLFITLLMLFCSTVFGQQQFYWQPPGPGSFQDQMSISAIIQIDGENPNRSDLEMAAFCNGVVRGSAKSIIWPGADGNTETLVVITIQGNNKDDLKFKLYVPGDGTTEDRILDTDFTIDLDTEYHGSLETLNFYEKHFNVDNEYDLSMTVGATVRIDGVDPKRTDLELAAFCGNEVRGVAKAIYWQSQDMYYYELIVGGRIDGEEITYKLYDPIADVDLHTDYKTTFKDGSTIDDGYGKPVTIEFKNNPVAMITNATGNHYFSSLEAAVAAAQNDETILLLQDVTLTETLTIEKSITIDGNGFEILPADDSETYNSAIMVGNSGWGDDHGEVITLNNIEFNNWKSNYGVVRAQGVTLNMTACKFNGNDVSDAAYGVLSLNYTDATVTNSIFKQNQDRAIDINYNVGDNSTTNAEVTIVDCIFEENVSDGAGIVVRNKGEKLVVKDSKFLNNTVTTNGNAATIYAGWGTSDVITGCYFDGNNVTTSHATTKRFASAIFCDGCAVTGNAFGVNTATRNGETITTTVAVGAYYGAANISENYWGGSAPVPGEVYTVEFTNNNVAINDYYKEYSEGTLSDKVTLNNVAKAGKYYYESITAAFAAVQDGETVTMLDNVSLSESIKVNNKITLDLNGKTITGTDNATVSFALFEVQPSKELTVKDENNTGKITLTATNNRGWNAYSSVISNQRGKLTVNGGTIEHLGGTDMAYGIDNLTNGKGTYAETIINGGTVKSLYRAIRQFLNGIEAQNILTVNGGTIEGANKSIWMQSANANANPGKLTIVEGVTVKGNILLEAEPNATSWPVEVSIVASTLKDGAQVMTEDLPSGYELVLENGVYSVYHGVAKIGNIYYDDLSSALNAITSGCTLDILTDITITEKWDCRNTGAKIGVPVTINGNGKTIKFTGEINDGYNHLAAFRFEAPVTVNNLVVDMSEAVAVFQNRFSAISTKANLTVNESKFIGSTTYANSRAIIFGEGGHEGLEIVVNETEFINWKYGVVDNMNRGDVKSVTITDNTFDNADVLISAKETVTFTGNDMSSNSYVNISSYSVPNEVAVTAKENTNLATNTETECNQIVAPLANINAQDGFLTPVAEAGGKYYVTLQGAVNGVADSGTITLLSDIELAAQDAQELFKPAYNRESYCGVYIPDDKTVVLELNGKTVSYLDTKDDVDNVMVMNLGNLTINDNSAEKTGKITYKPVAGASQYAKFYSTIFNCGTLTVNAGTIENTAEAETDVTNAVDNHSRLSHEYDNNSILIVNGGTLSGAYYYAIRQYTHYFEGVQNRVVINDGNINGGIYMQHGDSWYYANAESNRLNVDCYLEIKGGNINVNTTLDAFGKIKSRLYNPDNNAFGLNISGGIINVPVELLVQRGVYYANGVSGTTVPAETPGTRNAEWLAKNDGFVQGGTFSQIGGEEEHTTNLELFLKKGYKLEQNENDTYGVVVDPEYGKQAKIVKDGTTTYYTTIADAITAAQPGETVTILDGEYTADITINKAITVVGETDEQGDNLVNITGRVSASTGATVKNLNVNNTKTGDYDCALNVNGKDIVVDGVNLTGYNAMRYCYASGNITIKNSTINGSNFAVHFDGSAGGNIVFENTDITGWASYASTVNSVSYTDCDFDQGSYSGHRYYNKNISFNECTFNAGLLIDLRASGSNVAFTDEDMTVAEVKALFKDPYYVANGNVTLNDVQVTYAASGYTASGSKYFDNLQDAINEVNNGGYITVRSDIELTQGVTVPAGKEITLGLNGYTITGTPTEAAAFAVIKNSGNLTITDDTEAKDGKIICNHNLAPSTGYAVNTITNNGTLTVVAGTIENKSTYTSSNQIGYAIDNYSGAAVVIKGGNVTASGSTYYDGIRQFCNSETLENNVTIEGGEVSTLWIQNPSNDNEKDVKGSFAITGGTLNSLYLEPSANFSGSISGGHVGSISRHQSGDNDIVSFITGGTFGMDVTEFCAFNYVCTSNGNGTYGIEYKSQEEDAFVIETLHELEAFRNAVNAGNTFAGQTVVLSDDVNLAPTRAAENWIPIGTIATPFKGTFDGGNNTISNLNVDGGAYVGLFGYADNATIKNVNIMNANVKGTDCVGVIAGNVYSTSLIDNCHVSGSIKVEGQTNVGGIVGKYYTKVTNSSVIGDGVATSYVKGVYYAADYEGDNIGGIMGHGGENNTFTNNTVKNITISGTRKVGGIVGVTDQNTDVTNCLVENVNIETTATAQYATDNAAKAGHASIVGSYTKLGANNNGTVTNCVVKNVTFVNNVNVTMSAGPITGGAREGMVDPTGVTASGNLIYMSTITGNTTNMYLMNAVAMIGETKYYTLQEAVAASETNETTIDVIANTAETINVQEGANITINNINLTGSILAPNATLKIVNGSIVNNNSNVSAIEINAGTLNLEGVNISSARHGVRIDGAVTATINGGEYTLTATSGTRHAVNVSGGAEVTIKAGTFVGPAGTTMDSGSAVCVQAGATVTIEGGDFSKGKNATLGVSGTMIVKGGTFDQDPSAYLADAYTVNIENEMYVVRYTPIMVTYPVGNPVYPEGKVEYYSDMLEAVPYTTNCPRLEGATITLLADVSGAGMRFMENDMVFDLNGHTYTITDGTGSQGTNTSGFQIRPEVTTNVLFKNGTIKVAEGAPVAWMFNCYATDFIVENVTVDCSNMAYSYGNQVYVVVSREGDNVQLTGETKIVNFNSNVAGNAINVGDTMTIGEDVDLGGGTIELDGGAQLTAPANLNVVTVDGYMVVYENGVYKSVKVVAQVGDVKYESVAAAMTAAKEAGVKDLEITIIGENTQDTDDSFNLSYATAFDNVTIKQNNDNKPFYIESIYTGDRTSTDGKFVFDGVNMIITGQIWFECDVVLTNNSSVKRSNDVKNFIYYGEVTVEPGSKYISQIDDVMAGSFTVDGGKTDGTYNEAEDFKTVFFDVRYGQTFTAKNGANILISSGEGGKLSLMGNANIDASKVYVYNEIALGDNGKFALDIESSVTTKNVTGKGVISVDALNINEGVVYNVITANMSSFAGIIEINNDDAEYEITSTGLVVKMKPFVAEVDGTQFTSLQAAIDAADGKTVVVLDNITLTETVTVAAGTTVTLDLKGKTVSQEKECTASYQMIENKGALTIKDSTEGANGKISFNDTGDGDPNFGWGSYTIGNYGTLVVENGTIENISEQNPGNGQPVVHMYCAIQQGSGAVSTTINGGTISTPTYRSIRTNTGALVINGGTFVGQVWLQPNQGNTTLEVNGGNFSPAGNDGSSIFMTNAGENHTVSSALIKGGFFNTRIGSSNPEAEGVKGSIIGGIFTEAAKNGTNSALVHEYFEFVENEDGNYGLEQVLFAQTTELQAGWNWFSSYVDLSTPDGLEKIQTALGTNGIQIKGNYNNNSSTYENLGNGSYAWIGDFTPSAKQMYMINTSSAVTINVAGEMVDYKETPINLRSGWNWIGYPVSEAVDVNTALADLNGKVSGGDVIKTFGKSSQYSATSGKWVGQLKELKPGEGYMYKSSTSTSFVYSVGTGSKVENVDRTIEEKYWMSDVSEYANNMTVVAMLSIDGEIVKDNYEIAAFVNGECRGSERPIYVEELDAYVLFLTVHGDDVEELTFKYYDVNYGTEYELSNRINYSNDAVVGSVDEPYMFNLDILNIGETSVENISIYPNPTTTGSEINLQAVCDKVEVFNALGVKVAEYTNVDSIDAIETAGVYVIRLTIDNSARNCRLIVK